MDYTSGRSSPASSMYGESMLGSSDSYHGTWGSFRSSSPAGNSSVLMLPSSHRSSSSTVLIQSLELRIQKLESDKSVLRVQNDTIMAAYQELVHAVRTLLAVTSNPFAIPVSAQASTHLVHPSLLPLARTDYPKVRFWQRLDFTKGSGSDSVSNNSGPNLRGGTLVSQGVNTMGRYIEDQQGKVVDGHRLSAICKLAARIWFSLVAHGNTPRTWGQASIDVVTLYNNEMCCQFPELRLCADNWKAQKIATVNYPSWIRTHGREKDEKDEDKISDKKLKARHGSGSAPTKHRRDSSPAPPTPELRKKVKLGDEDLLSFNPLWQPPAASTVTTGSVEALVEDSTLLAPEPGSVGPSPDVPVIGEAAAPVIEVINDSRALEDDAQPAVATTTLVATETAVSITPPEVINPATVAAVRAALIQSAFPPLVLPVPTAPEAVAAPILLGPSATKKTGKKNVKMSSTNSLTPRNLCSREWINKHHGSRPAFGAYWDSIVGTEDEQHWNAVSEAEKKTASKSKALAVA
ncbi:hypothetical protein B0H10DRAFT_2014594 [Mycena sp. CBHHK59/15]|nr:hypothetical protein B0H10DRAFT_2014594 [Mycena sp. CBHHK59/15]